MGERGRFVVFEGVDHCGKTSQVDRAEAFLKERNLPYRRLREPGGTLVGERIRELLLNDKKIEISPRAELMLFFASRFQLCETVIEPALNDGMTVLLDRYYYSSAAYQGPFSYGSTWVLYMAEHWLRLRQPDLVIYLDGRPEILSARAHGPGDRIESKGLDYQKQVRDAYQAMAADRTNIFATIDAEDPIDKVWGKVKRALSYLLGVA
jgi:dTMP kinase